MAWFSYRKAGLCGALILCTVLHSFTVFAAENRDDYRLVFDADYYYNEYPDLQETLGNDSEALFSHFVTKGAREGRAGNADFNLRAYVLHNQDLLNAYQTNLSAYCRHFAETGKDEGRISQPTGEEHGLIGTYSTNYDPTLPRAVNIAVAVGRVNGTVLQPGEVFSFSRAVLPRTPQNGYVMAPAIGRYEYGGGICQLSSTLYAAMCDALLPAVERHPHSSAVSYIPVGLDATISEGQKDLRFANIYQEPLRISVETNEGTLSVSLYLGEESQEAGEDPAQKEEVQESESPENEIVGLARDLVKTGTE